MCVQGERVDARKQEIKHALTNWPKARVHDKWPSFGYHPRLARGLHQWRRRHWCLERVLCRRTLIRTNPSSYGVRVGSCAQRGLDDVHSCLCIKDGQTRDCYRFGWWHCCVTIIIIILFIVMITRLSLSGTHCGRLLRCEIVTPACFRLLL